MSSVDSCTMSSTVDCTVCEAAVILYVLHDSSVYRSRLIARHQWCDLTSEVKILCFSDRYMLVQADNFEPGFVLI